MTEVTTETPIESFEKKKAAAKGKTTVQEQVKIVEEATGQPEDAPYPHLREENKQQEEKAEVVIGEKKETVAEKKGNKKEVADEQETTTEEKPKKFWERKKPEEKEKILIPVEVEEELKYLRSIAGKASVRQALELEKNGKDYLEYAEEIVSKNPAKMPLTEIFKLQMIDAGKSGAELDNLVESFELKDEIDQIALTAPKKKELAQQYKETFSAREDGSAEEIKKAVEQRKAWDNFGQEIDEYLDSYKGSEHLGIKVTDKMVEQWREALQGAIPKRKDGTFEPREFADRDFLYINREKIFESIYNNAFAEALTTKRDNETQSGKSTQSNGSPTTAGRKELTGQERFNKVILPTLPTRGGS